MADNYLERQYAEYEKKKAAWEKAKRLGKLPKPKAKPIPPAAAGDSK